MSRGADGDTILMSAKPPATAFWPQRAGGDRRRFARHDDALYVRLTRNGSGPGERCELIDISEGGMSIATPEGLDLPIDTSVVLEFPLGRTASRIQTHAIVRSFCEGDQSEVHLEFYDDSALFRQTILACIVSWGSKPTPDRRHPRP